MSPQRRVRLIRDALALALANGSLPGLNFHITNRGRDVREPKAFLEVQTGDHAYTITITEDH